MHFLSSTIALLNKKMARKVYVVDKVFSDKAKCHDIMMIKLIL